MKAPNPRTLTVGIVFHNEEPRLARFLEKLTSSLPTDAEILILGFDNRSTDRSYEIFRDQCSRLKLSAEIIRGEFNNMGSARASILAKARSEFLYFIDVDVVTAASSVSKLMSALESHRFDRDIIAAAGPLIIAATNAFQIRLSSLQKVWLGHFGSAQMKTSFKSATVEHAPTAHLLIKTESYITAGSFNSFFDRSGEDLEVHWRLARNNQKIAWVQDAPAVHEIAANLGQWLRKCFKYGIAQTQIARIHPQFFLTKRCLPLWMTLLAIICIDLNSLYFSILLGAYVIAVLSSAMKVNFKWSLRLSALMFATHLFYLLGEIFGLLRSPETSTSKK